MAAPIPIFLTMSRLDIDTYPDFLPISSLSSSAFSSRSNVNQTVPSSTGTFIFSSSIDVIPETVICPSQFFHTNAAASFKQWAL